MLSRRTFIASTFGASTAISLGAKAQPALLMRAIADHQFEAGRFLVSQLAPQGVKTTDPEGEMVSFLKRDMPHWKYGQEIIGFTSHTDFQILEAFVKKSGGSVDFASLAGPARRQTISGALDAASSQIRPLLSTLLDIQHAAKRTGVAWIVRAGPHNTAKATARRIA